MLRFSERVAVTVQGDHVTVSTECAPVLRLPTGARDVRLLARLLSEPREEAAVRAALPPESLGTLQALLDVGAVVADPLPDRLLAMHRETVTGGRAEIDGSVDDQHIARRRLTGPWVGLDPPGPPSTSLVAALAGRRSHRRFDDAPLALDDLATVLGLGAGSASDGRAYPSGGRLYVIEPHVVALRVDGLPPGSCVRYDVTRHALEAAGGVTSARWLDCIPDLSEPGPGALLLLVADLSRPSAARYDGLTYRLALLEAGHLAQNVMLASVAIGLGSLGLCGFDGDALAEAAALAVPYEVVLYVVALGWPETPS